MLNTNEIIHFTKENFQELIDQCKQMNNWKTIEFIFSNRLNLSTSFLKKDFTGNISMNYQSTSVTPKSEDFLFEKKIFIGEIFRYSYS